MIPGIVITIILKIVEVIAERYAKTMFVIKTRVRKLKPFDRRKRTGVPHGEDQ